MSQAVAGGAKLTVLYAEKLNEALDVFTRKSPKHPTPAYITSGPVITRWGALNPAGHPFFQGRQRVRFSLEVASDVGIAEVKIIDAGTGTVFRQFKTEGAKSFSCMIDETHKSQWSLVPIVTDVNGRTALAGTLQTYQDGNRVWMMGDRLMGMHHAHGWDKPHRQLKRIEGWLGSIPWAKNWKNSAGGYPDSPLQDELRIYGIDGGVIYPGAVDISPSVTTDLGKEPKVEAYRFKNRLASFDVAVMDYTGDSQFTVNKRQELKKIAPDELAAPNPDPQIPMEAADIVARTTAVRGRVNAAVASNIHDIFITFKKDVDLKRIDLCGTRRCELNSPMYLAVRDDKSDLAWLLEAEARFSRTGVLPAGGYLYPAHERGGAVGVINLGPQELGYQFGMPRGRVFIDGMNRRVKAGEKIHARFITFLRPWEDQNNNQWLKKFISDFGIGLEKPGYSFAVTQGKLLSTNYTMELQTENGGARVKVDKYDLPHNLLVQADGFAANAVVGRYDLDKKQLLILPVLEGNATTSVNTTSGDTNLYIGELFHCDNNDVMLSCVQDGTDKLLLEIHNPTGKPQTAKLSASAGFAPLAGLDRTLDVPAFSSVKLELPAAAASITDKPYEGD